MIKSFKVDISEDSLQNIYSKVKNYQWHEMPDDGGWDYGTNLNYMKEFSKFWIEKFEHSDVEKGYANPDKYCLIFSKSENIKILYSGTFVQGRQLQTSDEMDKMKVIDESDVDWRFQQSSGELQNRYAHKTKKQMRENSC